MSKLLNDFFFTDEVKTDGTAIHALVKINAAHAIFEGHFPGMPVVPGVCMMQMVKEILEHETGKKLSLQKADHIKFLSVLNPNEHTDLKTEIQITEAESTLNVTASLFNNSTIFFKLKGTFSA